MKKLSASIIGSASTLLAVTPAFAQSVGCPEDSTLAICNIARQPIGNILADVIQFIFVIAVILALGFLVYGGIKWLTSGGDKEGVASARGTIIAAIIGLVVIFLAYVILNLVLQFLTGQSFGQIEIPNLTSGT